MRAAHRRREPPLHRDVTEPDVHPVRPKELDELCRAFPGRAAVRHRERLDMQARDEWLSLIAWETQRPVGHLFVKWPWARDAYEAPVREWAPEVRDLFVVTQHRRRGFGTALMREAERAAARRGFARICLTVDPTNRPAAGLYAGLGYREDGHGPWIGSARLPTDQGGWEPVGGWMICLVKEL